jgi:hypothetical protein
VRISTVRVQRDLSLVHTFVLAFNLFVVGWLGAAVEVEIDHAAALIMGDRDAIQAEARAMNAGDMYPLFAAMLTHKTYAAHDTTRLMANVG